MTKLKELTEALDVANRKIATLERRLKRFKDYEKDTGNKVHPDCRACFWFDGSACLYRGRCIEGSKFKPSTKSCKRCGGRGKIGQGSICPGCQGEGVDLT